MKNSSFAFRHSRRGFSLMELLVVIAIIVILASLVLGGLGFMERNKQTQKCKTQIALLSTALEEYKMDFGLYPPVTNTSDGTGQSVDAFYSALFYEGYEYNKDAPTYPSSWTKTVGGSTFNKSKQIYLAELDSHSSKQKWLSKAVSGSATQPAPPAKSGTLATTILDPWGNEYRFRSGINTDGSVNNDCKNPDFDLWSIGSDGKPGNAAGTDEDAQDNESNWK